jgi:hypothetical protein
LRGDLEVVFSQHPDVVGRHRIPILAQTLD